MSTLAPAITNSNTANIQEYDCTNLSTTLAITAASVRGEDDPKSFNIISV